MGLFEPEEPQSGSRLRSLGIALALLAAPIVAWRACQTAPDLDDEVFELPIDPTAPERTPAEDAAKAVTAPPPRCKEISPEPFIIGDPPVARPKADVDASPFDQDPDDFDELAPFAVEIGSGTTYDGGFAAGTLRSAEGGTVAMLVTLGQDGRGGKLVRLTRTRGDLDPPVVFGVGPSVLVALLEPNAAGRAIKIAKVTGQDVTWGAELSEGRDESMALGLAASGARAVIVWDDVARGRNRSRIMLASFDTATLQSVTSARPVSPPKLDAEEPRIIARPGGYWLAYTVLGEPPKPKKGAEDDEDDLPAGEAIIPRWVELMPLDESGAPVSASRRATPKQGHVLAFDIELGQDGGAMIAWRDDDTPSGSSGGRVSAVLARLGGIGEPHVLAEEGIGPGVPGLLPGWLAVSSIRGAVQLAAMTPLAQMNGPLAPERVLGNAEPLAVTGELMFLAHPAGKALKLTVARCVHDPSPEADAAAGARQ